jgi:hypothetical protein
MGMSSFVVAEMGCHDNQYDNWLTTLTEASMRLDGLQTAVTELCNLCEKDDVNREQVLEVLERHGAISPRSRLQVRRRTNDAVQQMGFSRP